MQRIFNLSCSFLINFVKLKFVLVKIDEMILQFTQYCLQILPSFIISSAIFSKSIIQYIMIHLYYPKFIEEPEYRIHFDQKLTQRFLYSFFWDLAFEKYVKNSWKFLRNTFIILSLEFELFFTLFPFTFTFSVRRRPQSLFPC